MAAFITLTTDLGLSDGYVAAMKGVMLGINPEARLVDICHTIKPQNIAQAAFVLGQACYLFPQGTVHVVVVDPGVGTERRAVVLKTGSQVFVAPDNGVLSYVVPRSLGKRGQLGPAAEAVVISRPQFWRPEVSPTFHGRDIFAPVAAWLSRGVPVTDFGEVIHSVTVLPLTRPRRMADGSVVGHVIHIDGFGNLISDIKRDRLPPSEPVTVKVGDYSVSGLSRTYAEGRGLVALMGSEGYLEVALRDGDASLLLGAKVGDEVRLS